MELSISYWHFSLVLRLEYSFELNPFKIIMNYKKSNKLLPSSYNYSKDRTSISLYSRSARITNLRLKENYKMPIVKDQHLLITYRGRK